mmetsp:Transcript_16369/g.40794  ORF Transcript_16369/g.40794 Transcript_16369/m.40794 type:complete len:209 (-) Transcript_16369:1381-2007(-)
MLCRQGATKKQFGLPTLGPSCRPRVGRPWGTCRAFPRDDHFAPEPLQEVVTFITPEGLVRLPGRLVRDPRQQQPRTPRLHQPLPTTSEQALCVGASFLVEGRNALDPHRRVGISGFCQSVDLLAEAVGERVLGAGGEVLGEEVTVKSGLHEVLTLTVAVPYLFFHNLAPITEAITLGGGVVDRVVYRWHMMQRAGGGGAGGLQRGGGW